VPPTSPCPPSSLSSSRRPRTLSTDLLSLVLAVGAGLARVLVRGVFVSCVPRREIGISGATDFKYETNCSRT
jgi:hypothetical protein